MACHEYFATRPLSSSLVGLIPLMFLEGDFLSCDGGLGSIGRAGDDTFATSSFNLFDFKLDLGTLGITYPSARPLEVDGWDCLGKLDALVVWTEIPSLGVLTGIGISV